MFHRGIEFAVVATGVPGIWRWRFWIGGKSKTGRAETKLELMAIRRVKLRIDRELNEIKRRAAAPKESRLRRHTPPVRRRGLRATPSR
jgi:hypothetical protein